MINLHSKQRLSRGKYTTNVYKFVGFTEQFRPSSGLGSEQIDLLTDRRFLGDYPAEAKYGIPLFEPLIRKRHISAADSVMNPKLYKIYKPIGRRKIII